MAYVLLKTNGQVISTIQDGTAQNIAGLTIIGSKYQNYAQVIANDTISLAENFASNTSPSGALVGQLWYDTATAQLKIYTDDPSLHYKNIWAGAVQAIAPSYPSLGDQWFDPTLNALGIWNGTSWTQINSPQYENNGIRSVILYDTANQPHPVLEVVAGIDNTLVAIINDGVAFTPNVGIIGFITVGNGITANAFANIEFVGSATNANALGNVVAANYARTDVSSTFAANVTVQDHLTVNTASIYSSTANSDVFFTTTKQNANIILAANVGGAVTTSIIIEGTGEAQVPASPVTGAGIANKLYVDTIVGGILTTANHYTDLSITNLIGGAPAPLNNLSGIANAINNDGNFASTVANNIAVKADIASPYFTGNPRAPTRPMWDGTNSIASTEFVQTAIAPINAALGSFAPIASPSFTGVPKAPSPPPGDATNQLPTTSWVASAINAAISGVPVVDVFPVGGIIMWSGAANTIPAKWALCDGTNNTPDLRNRFIMGAGGQFAPGTTGGSPNSSGTTSYSGGHAHNNSTFGAQTVTTSPAGANTPTAASASSVSTSAPVTGLSATIAGHALTVAELPAHNHGFPGDDQLYFGGASYAPSSGWQNRSTASIPYDAISSLDGGWRGRIWLTTDTGAGAAHSHGFTLSGGQVSITVPAHTHTISSIGDHTHPVSSFPAHSHTMDTQGVHNHTVSVDITPPYYALCFIMKIR